MNHTSYIFLTSTQFSLSSNFYYLQLEQKAGFDNFFATKTQTSPGLPSFFEAFIDSDTNKKEVTQYISLSSNSNFCYLHERHTSMCLGARTNQ